MIIRILPFTFKGWFRVIRRIYDYSDLNDGGFCFIIYARFGVGDGKLKF